MGMVKKASQEITSCRTGEGKDDKILSKVVFEMMIYLYAHCWDPSAVVVLARGFWVPKCLLIGYLEH